MSLLFKYTEKITCHSHCIPVQRSRDPESINYFLLIFFYKAFNTKMYLLNITHLYTQTIHSENIYFPGFITNLLIYLVRFFTQLIFFKCILLIIFNPEFLKDGMLTRKYLGFFFSINYGLTRRDRRNKTESFYYLIWFSRARKYLFFKYI